MVRSARITKLTATATADAQEAAGFGVEYTPEFQELDALVNAFDAEGLGPLRKGERPFQWDTVADASQALLAQSADLRVAIWLLRAWLEQRGVSGLLDGLTRICEMLQLPEQDLFPRAMEGEHAREVHAVSLAWLGSAALLHQFRQASLVPAKAMSCADLHKDASLVQTLESSVRTDLCAQLQQGLVHLEQINAILQESQTELAFNTAPLHEEIAFAAKTLQASASQQSPAASPTASKTAQPHQTVGTAIHRREEVHQALASLISYFREHEPSHPAPLLLLRVQRMLGASFEELMSELYADAAQLVARIEKPQSH